VDERQEGSERNAPVRLPVLPPEDDELPGFPEAKRAKSKTWFPGGNRRRWKAQDGTIYEWDYENGKVEVYARRGEPHRGEYDPKTGDQTKPPNPQRSVEP
jgi:hypothetical protein